jgi:rSAM/selenodomain-associated transferase 1
MGSFRRTATDNRAPGQSRPAHFRCRLIIMAKVPVAGNVKTRLAHDIGAAHAVRFCRHATAALLARVGNDPRWQTILAVTPDCGVAFRLWPQAILRIGQGGGDLGQRMQRLMDRPLLGPTIIIGTDVPGISRPHIAAAFRKLGRHDAVFGPATDGGYWLVGFKRRPHLSSAFRRVRWSSAHALQDTLANLQGRRVAFITTLRDIDTSADLQQCTASVGRRVG